MKDITIFIQEALSNTAKKEAEGKMDAWHNGTRKQNIKSCSNEKLIMNYGICMAKGYEKEAAELKAEMDKRNIKIDESLEDTKFVIVAAYNEAYKYFEEEYADAMIATDNGNYFIIPEADVQKVSEELKEKKDAKFFNFPKGYKTIDDVEEALKNGELDPEDDKLAECEIKL